MNQFSTTSATTPQFCQITEKVKTSLLRRLQAPVGKIHQFRKIAVTFEPIQDLDSMTKC